MPKETFQTLSFIATVVLVTAAFIWLLLPYYSAILWAVVLAVLFNPLHTKLLGRLAGHRNLAAALSVLGCICIGIIPASLILAALAHEAAGLYVRITLREFDPVTILARAQGALPPVLLDAASKLNLDDLAQAQAPDLIPLIHDLDAPSVSTGYPSRIAACGRERYVIYVQTLLRRPFGLALIVFRLFLFERILN